MRRSETQADIGGHACLIQLPDPGIIDLASRASPECICQGHIPSIDDGMPSQTTQVVEVACPPLHHSLDMGSVRDRRRKVPWKNEPSMLKLVCRSVQNPDATNSLQGLKLSNQGPPRSNDDSGQACLDNNALERATLRTSRFDFASAALPVCEDSCGIHTSIAITSGKLW